MIVTVLKLIIYNNYFAISPALRRRPAAAGAEEEEDCEHSATS